VGSDPLSSPSSGRAPSNLDAQLAHAHALCELRRFPEAVNLLREVIAAEPQGSHTWSLLAMAELGAKDLRAGLHAAETAISLAPEEEWPHRLASTALRLMDRSEESVQHAREAVRLDPDGWQTHTTLARALAQRKSNLAQARAAADRAIGLAPEQAEAYITAGAVAVTSKRRTEAETSFRRALAIDPNNSVAHTELARLQIPGRLSANAAGLADAATDLARVVRDYPRADFARRHLDRVLHLFLARVAYIIFLDAFLIARLTSGSAQLTTRLLPVVMLAVPAAFAWRFITDLNTDLRRYLLQLLTRNRQIRLAAGLNVLAVLCLLVAAMAPQSARIGLAGLATAAGLVGRLALLAQVERSSRAVRGLPARPMLGAPMMWFLALALMLMAVFLLIATSTSGAGLAGVVLAILCAGGSVVLVNRIKERGR
jgi:tetratricopeptide (TPR) repeat protein